MPSSALATVSPTGIDSHPAPRLLPTGREHRRLHLVPDAQSMLAVDFRSGRHDREFGPQHSSTADLPDPIAWSSRMLLGLMEAMNGLRPPTQVERCLALELRDRIHHAHAVSCRRGARSIRPSQVLRVRACTDIDGIAEVSAVVYDRERVRAIAMRLVGCDGRWLVTKLVIG